MRIIQLLSLTFIVAFSNVAVAKPAKPDKSCDQHFCTILPAKKISTYRCSGNEECEYIADIKSHLRTGDPDRLIMAASLILSESNNPLLHRGGVPDEDWYFWFLTTALAYAIRDGNITTCEGQDKLIRKIRDISEGTPPPSNVNINFLSKEALAYLRLIFTPYRCTD